MNSVFLHLVSLAIILDKLQLINLALLTSEYLIVEKERFERLNTDKYIVIFDRFDLCKLEL
jgi:hypothetical protein